MNKRLTLRKFIKQFPCIVVCEVLVFLLTFMVNSLFVHAAGNENVSYFPMSQNDNGHFSDDCISSIESAFNSVDNNIFVSFYNYYDNSIYFYVLVFPKNDNYMVYGEIDSNAYQFGLYSIGSSSNVGIAQCRYSVNEGVVWLSSGSFGVFSVLDSSKYNSNKSYVSNFQLYTNNTDNAGIVLKYGDDFPSGEARKPFFNHNPEYALNDSPPLQVPESPTINNYTWNTYNPPVFDNSSVLNAIESLGDKIEYTYVYLIDGIHGEIYTLNGNIKAYFEYIGDTLQYYGNLIIGNIQEAMTNFYENMVSLIEPIFDFMEKVGVIAGTLVALGTDENGNFSIPVLFSTLFVPSSTDVITVLLANDSLDLIPLVNAVFSKEVTIVNQIHNLTPAKTFHVPSLIYHGVQIGNFDIDFSWFEPYKSYSDTIISVFLVFGWLYWLLVSVSHLLRGIHGQGESVTAADNYAAGWHYDV